MKKSEVYSEEILICNECYAKVEECWNCGGDFKEGDAVYCDNETGAGHYCEKCSKLKGIDF
jgi:hypothetical protein